MAVPGLGTAPLNNPDHRAEHERIIPALDIGPRGIVAYQLGVGVGLGFGNTATIIYQFTNVQLQAGRMYLLGFGVRAIQIGPFQSGVPPGIHFFTEPMRPTGTTLIIDAWVYNNYGTTYEHIYWEQPFIVKYDLTLSVLQIKVSGPNTSYIWTDYGGHMRIEDIGADTMSRTVF